MAKVTCCEIQLWCILVSMLGYAHYVPGVHMLLGVGVSHQRHNRGQTPDVCVGTHFSFNLRGNVRAGL